MQNLINLEEVAREATGISSLGTDWKVNGMNTQRSGRSNDSKVGETKRRVRTVSNNSAYATRLSNELYLVRNASVTLFTLAKELAKEWGWLTVKQTARYSFAVCGEDSGELVEALDLTAKSRAQADSLSSFPPIDFKPRFTFSPFTPYMGVWRDMVMTGTGNERLAMRELRIMPARKVFGALEGNYSGQGNRDERLGNSDVSRETILKEVVSGFVNEVAKSSAANCERCKGFLDAYSEAKEALEPLTQEAGELASHIFELRREFQPVEGISEGPLGSDLTPVLNVLERQLAERQEAIKDLQAKAKRARDGYEKAAKEIKLRFNPKAKKEKKAQLVENQRAYLERQKEKTNGDYLQKQLDAKRLYITRKRLEGKASELRDSCESLAGLSHSLETQANESRNEEKASLLRQVAEDARIINVTYLALADKARDLTSEKAMKELAIEIRMAMKEVNATFSQCAAKAAYVPSDEKNAAQTVAVHSDKSL